MVKTEMEKIRFGTRAAGAEALTTEKMEKAAGGQEFLCYHLDPSLIVRTGNVYGGILYMDSGAYVCNVEYKCTRCGAVWTRKEKIN